MQKKDNASVRLLGKGPAVCSGKISATAVIFTGKCAITSIVLCTDGTNDGITVADASGGTILRQFTVTGNENFGGNAINYPIYVDTSIHVTLAGTGAFCFIDYLILDA